MKLPALSIILGLASGPALRAAVNITTTFSSAEGYVAGSIDRDDNPSQPRIWERVNAATSASFIVGPPGVTIGRIASGSAQAVYQTAIDFSENPVTTFVDFTFSRNTTTPPDARTVIGMAYLNNATAGNYSNFSAIFGLTNTGYRIAWGNSSDTAITETELGLDLANSDFDSAALRLSMTVTRLSSTADTFTKGLTLTNLATGMVIASITPANFTDATVYADNTAYTSFHSSFNNNAPEVTAVSVSQFGISQVPEPAAAILALAGLLPWLRRRR